MIMDVAVSGWTADGATLPSWWDDLGRGYNEHEEQSSPVLLATRA